MKIFAKHVKIQEFLKSLSIEDIEVVEEQIECNYMISGKLIESDVHENLRGVIIPYTGHNGIDLQVMRDHNLQLYITPTRSKYVAEKAVTLTLSLLGKVIDYHTLLKEGNWSSRNSDERVPWISIQDLTIGLYGYGRIGQYIHKMMSGFGCEFYTIDRNKSYPKGLQTVKNLTNLVQVSDVVIIATPLNSTTENAFDKRLLSRMKHKFLINIGRGKVVNEKDLYEALVNKNLAGYASDVWYNYPKGKEMMLPSSYPIHELDNVVLSNHSGGFTVKTNAEVNEDLVKTLIKIKNNDFSDKLDLTNLI